MSQDIRDFVTSSCELLGLGEPTHLEPAFARVRNEVVVQLVALGFRSVVLETDRVAAQVVDDFVRGGVGSLDSVMGEGFSHGFGQVEANRELVAWMRSHNSRVPFEERVAFCGFDTPVEMVSAPSPLPYLGYVRDYLGVDLDLSGDDEVWSRSEAVLDPASSMGASAEAVRLRVVADDLLVSLYARASELVAATSRAEWTRARVQLGAGLGLLRYHGQSARVGDRGARMSGQLGVRDVVMAQNLLDVLEERRGPALVFAHNHHLQRCASRWRLWGMDLEWSGAGAIVGALVGERYRVVLGSLGRADALGLAEPAEGDVRGVAAKAYG